MSDTSSALAASVVRLDDITPLPDWPFDLVQLRAQHMTVVRVHRPEGHELAMHSHAEEQVSYVLSGQLRFSSGGREVVVDEGEVVIVPPGVAHASEALTDAVMLEIFSPACDFA